MSGVFRAEVPLERLAYCQLDGTGGKFRELNGLRDHIETRVWAFLGAGESGIKTALAGLAFLVARTANQVMRTWGNNYPVYRDIAETQFRSFWRCALAVYSPTQALGTGDWIKKRSQDWGTEYNPEKTGIIEKCYPWTIKPEEVF